MSNQTDLRAALHQRLASWPPDADLVARLQAGEPVRFLLELTEPNAFWSTLGASALAATEPSLQRVELAALGLSYVAARVDAATLLQLAALPGVGRVDIDEPKYLIGAAGGDNDHGN